MRGEDGEENEVKEDEVKNTECREGRRPLLSKRRINQGKGSPDARHPDIPSLHVGRAWPLARLQVTESQQAVRQGVLFRQFDGMNSKRRIRFMAATFLNPRYLTPGSGRDDLINCSRTH